jgi:uncharacterized repeat protein (TIGR01451 family)
MKKHSSNQVPYFLLFILLSTFYGSTQAQLLQNGSVKANFGIDAGLYSGVNEFLTGTFPTTTNDWFTGATGRGVIDESNKTALTTLLKTTANPLYEARMKQGPGSVVDISGTKRQLLIDALWARDHFGGTGQTDQTSFTSASKSGEDPANWNTGPQNVLGKNDIIDIGAHMLRDIDTSPLTPKNNLWFLGLINRAEPGGDAFMDYEFFARKLSYTAGAFISGGSDEGHTAFTFDANGNITKIGDFILSLSLTNGGVSSEVEARIWVSKADFKAVTPGKFAWGTEIDGASNNSLYGYASIKLHAGNTDGAGLVNTAGKFPVAPPWGTKGTKDHVWGTTYQDYSVAEIGLNLTSLGIDPDLVAGPPGATGSTPCTFPWQSFVIKTRASQSFTAQLKDFAGPYAFGYSTLTFSITGTPELTCAKSTTTLSTDITQQGATYLWTTLDGEILTDPTLPSIEVSKEGTYSVEVVSTSGCNTEKKSIQVTRDTYQPTVSLNELTLTCHTPTGVLTATGTSSNPLSYAWTVPAGAVEPGNVASMNVEIPGTYILTATDLAKGCIAIDTVVVGQDTIKPIVSVQGGLLTCEQPLLELTAQAQPLGVKYNWQGPDKVSDTTRILTVSLPGLYTLTVTNPVNGCTAIDTALVVLDPTKPIADAAVRNRVLECSDGKAVASTTLNAAFYANASWSQVGTSPSVVKFASTSDPKTEISGLVPGTYVLVWKAGTCADTVNITVGECAKRYDLALDQTVSTKLAQLGDTLSYTLRVWNEGEATAHGIEVTYQLPQGLHYLSSETLAGAYTPTTGQWSFDSLIVGDTLTLRIRVRVISPGVLFSTAEITQMNEKDIDSTPANEADNEDDLSRECITVPIMLCQGQGDAVQLNVPDQYSGVVWFRKEQNGSPVQVGTGNTYVATETEPGSYEYTFTSSSGNCPREGCCPLILVVKDCCPAEICVPFIIKKTRSAP